VQYLGGGTITIRRNRPAAVQREVLLKYLPEIKRLEGEGMLEVRTVSGQKVDLGTLQVQSVPVTPPVRTTEVPVPINPSPAFFPYMNSETVGAKPTTPIEDHVSIQPADVSLNIQRGKEMVTHSTERDPAKKRRQRRSE
jgi:hypothetical protein